MQTTTVKEKNKQGMETMNDNKRTQKVQERMY